MNMRIKSVACDQFAGLLDKELEFDDLFVISKNSDEEIQTVDFDPVVVNNVLNSITETVIAPLVEYLNPKFFT